MRCRANGRRSGPAMELVDVSGRTMTYHRAGDGPPLVLLHGGWSDGRAWRPQLGAWPTPST